MDYSIVLSQINSNQLEILSKLGNIENILEGIFLLFSIFFIYIFVKNLIKSF